MNTSEYLHGRAKFKAQDATMDAGHARVSIEQIAKFDTDMVTLYAALTDLSREANEVIVAWQATADAITGLLIELEVNQEDYQP